MTADPLEALLSRFDWRVEGLSHLAAGPALVVSPHGLMPWDGLLLQGAVRRELGRTLFGLSHHFWFKVPMLRASLAARGFVPGTPGRSRALLEEGGLVHTMPGGVPEAFRPSSEAYRVRWGRRMGYLRLGVELGVPLVPAVTGGIDGLYHVTGVGLPLRLPGVERPLPLAFGRWGGVWPLALPRGRRLLTVVGPALLLPSRGASEEELEEAHRQIQREVERRWREVAERVG